MEFLRNFFKKSCEIIKRTAGKIIKKRLEKSIIKFKMKLKKGFFIKLLKF